MLQPPQTPKCGQPGVTRWLDSLRTATTLAFSNFGFLRKAL